MLRISKLTDYGTVVMAYLASNPGIAHNAKDIAQSTHIAVPTVSKLLKLLTRGGLLTGQRGSKGGYTLALPTENISLADILYAIEGSEIALTECSHSKGLCAMETLCTMRSNWHSISNALRDTLSKISLIEMTKPIVTQHIQQHFKQDILRSN